MYKSCVVFPVGGGAVALGGAHFQKVPHGTLLREYFGFQRATRATAPPPPQRHHSIHFWHITQNELHSCLERDLTTSATLFIISRNNSEPLPTTS